MQVKKKYGFHGNYDMFKGLAFSTSCQLPNEPYHLWILGILRFFFKSVFFFFFSFSFFSFLFFFFFFFLVSPARSFLLLFLRRIVKNVLKPYQRDRLNFLVHNFAFKRGMPKISFDVTSATKNFSMSIMQQISIPFLFTLNLFSEGRDAVSDDIVVFWAELDQFIRDLFATSHKLSDIPNLQDRGIQVLKKGKAIIPKVTDKSPHNIHYAIEYLNVDLPVFVLGISSVFSSSLFLRHLLSSAHSSSFLRPNFFLSL